METGFLILAFTAVTLGGLIKGLSGFGYAVAATSLLASFYPASRAVGFMIIPLIAVQLQLASQLNRNEIKTCTESFKPYIVSITAGTVLGFYAISSILESPVKLLIGVLTFLFAVSRTRRFSIHFLRLKEKCFRRSPLLQVPLGFISGLIFGSSNVGVQIVAYLKSMDLETRKFAGILALIMIPISGIRIPITASNTPELLLYSLLAAPLGLIAASAGQKTRHQIPEKTVRQATIILLITVSIRLIQTAL